LPAPAPSLDRFFAPASIALIGASPDATKIRGRLLRSLRDNGYPGRLYPVNPSYREIDGLTCFPSVAAIDAPIDLALVAVPAETVLPALEACAAVRVAHAAIISSGFAEQGGANARLQDEIAALARRSGMRICGPNAEGFHNDIAHVAATFSPAVEVKPGEAPLHASERRIGIVAQSGGMGFALLNRGRALGLRFSSIVSTGNEADLTASDFFAHMAEDSETAAIMLFLETVRDAEGFLAAAAAATERGKPVIAVKIGRSAAGERAARSHTASMAGWDVAYDAVFRKYGIVAASDPDEAIAMAAVFTTCPLPGGERVAVVTTSGGAGAWAADALAGAGLALPELSPPLQQAIAAFIPPYGSARNPVDITAQAVHTGGLLRAIELLRESTEVDAIVAVVSLSSETRMTIDIGALKAIVERQTKPLLLYSYTLPSALARKMLASAGLPIHTGLATLAAAVSALARRARHVPARSVVRAPAQVATPVRAALKRGGALSEYDTKELLAATGIAMPPRRLVAEAKDLDAAAAALGFPLALKIQSPDIPHKTEAGGVRLGIADAASLRGAWDAVVAAARRHRPEARLQGVLLEPMARPGVEVILGTIRDKVFGPLVMVGAGGVMTELFRDSAYRLAPVDRAEAREMLQDLRIAKLLGGFRGAGPADVDALALLVAQLSAFALEHRDLVEEIELNPVVVHRAGEGCTIVDALLTLGPR
jgi:acetate---CoA ligase (ADP-forming)